MITKRRHAWWWVYGLVAVLLWPTTSSAQTDKRQAYLLNLLRKSTTFRVRAQAALSLATLKTNERSIAALSRALRRDKHPAVRIAAATALGRLGDVAALGALYAARKDRVKKVRVQIARAVKALERVAARRDAKRRERQQTQGDKALRYYVGVGMPATRDPGIDKRALKRLQSYLAKALSGMDGVRVAPPKESGKQAQRVLRQHMLNGYYLDSSVVRIEERGNGVRAVVSAILGTYPGRDMRAMMQGAATVQGATGPAATQRAIEGAMISVLRQMPRAMQASDARASRLVP
ncbi:MAG: HEAT repeat domain-containing protein [Polyangiales bacterium]